MSRGLNNFNQLNTIKSSASHLIKENSKPKKMTFDIDIELHNILKKHNKQTGITLGFMLNEAVRDYIQKKDLS